MRNCNRDEHPEIRDYGCEPFVFNIIGMWLIRIVGTFICTQMFGMGLVAAWGCMIAHNMFLFFMFFICYVKGIWNPLKKKL